MSDLLADERLQHWHFIETRAHGGAQKTHGIVDQLAAVTGLVDTVLITVARTETKVSFMFFLVFHGVRLEAATHVHISIGGRRVLLRDAISLDIVRHFIVVAGCVRRVAAAASRSNRRQLR